MVRPFDVCIRGGGITGRTLALLLARERLRVGFVAHCTDGVDPTPEPQPDPQGDVRAFALNSKSKELLESIRAWPGAADATPVLKMQVQGDAGGEVVFDAADCHAPALAWIVDVPVLQAQLAQAMQFQPQIELLDAAQPATLTVVCEGKASQSRAQFGVDFQIDAYAQQAIAARVVCGKPHQHTARQWFSREGILGVLPMGASTDTSTDTLTQARSHAASQTPIEGLEKPEGPVPSPQGNTLAIVWSVAGPRAQSLLAMSPHDFCRALQVATHGVYGTLHLSSERACWPLQLALADRWVGTTDGVAWALAGDAAHTVHPLTGQGLNLGLADVAELAHLIAGRDYWRSVADEKLLRRYERARKADAAALAQTTDGLQRLFAQNDGPWAALRNAGMNGFERSGPLKRWVARQAMGV